MRIVIFAITFAFFSGCASLERATSSDHLSNKERVAQQREFEKEADQIQKAKEALKVGDSEAQIKAIYGEPARTEFFNGMTVHEYADDREPVYFYFKDGRLIAKIYDREEGHRRELAAQMERQQRRAESDRSAAAWGNVLGGLAQPRQAPALMPLGGNTTRCTSRNVSGTVYTDCH